MVSLWPEKLEITLKIGYSYKKTFVSGKINTDIRIEFIDKIKTISKEK